MRYLVRLALTALLTSSIVACDSAEDTGLAACSFSYTATGDFTDEVAGRAYFTRVATPDASVTTYALEMTPNVVNGPLASASLIGIIPGSLSQRTYPVEGPGPGGDETQGYWFGSVVAQGATGLQSTEGSVTILAVSEDRIEGRFTIQAETDANAQATIEGRFNADLFVLDSPCVR